MIFSKHCWVLFASILLRIFVCMFISDHFSSVQLLSHVRLFATPWTILLQAPLSMEFSRQEYWSGLAHPSPEDLPKPGIEPRSPALHCIYCLSHEERPVYFMHSIINISWSLLKLMSIELVMPSNHLILCHPLLVLPSVFPSIRVFSNESVLHIRWPKHWSFSFSISPFSDFL